MAQKNKYFNVLFIFSNLFPKQSFKFTFSPTVYENYGIYHNLSTLATLFLCLMVIVFEFFCFVVCCFNQGYLQGQKGFPTFSYLNLHFFSTGETKQFFCL